VGCFPAPAVVYLPHLLLKLRMRTDMVLRHSYIVTYFVL
jgi:hypothetical protein